MARRRVCKARDCDNTIPKDADLRRKYCTDRCKFREQAKIRRAKQRDLRNQRATRGDIGAQLQQLGLDKLLVAGDLKVDQAAATLGVTTEGIRQALSAYIEDEKLAELEADWTMAEDIAKMLLPDPPPLDDPDAFEAWLDKAVEGFVAFRGRFFRLKGGKKYITDQFHRNWIKEVLRAILTGGQLMILSPPRHGKTELLIHFCVWLIARDPDISIMWVSGNAELASDMTGSVKAHLEQNEELITAVFPPGKQFQPTKRRGTTWTASSFTVDNRTVVGQKAPTMVALGRNGRILSRDCDFIVCDDIEDHESTQQEHQRAATRSWMTTQLDSRNEEHTGFVIIGSRQHPDDLYGHLLEDDGWATIVDSAHDRDCTLNPHDAKLHVDCMLFPELRTYRWLHQKRTSAAALGLEGHFEMVYLNSPRPSAGGLFDKENIEKAYNPSRPIGLDGIPTGAMRIAGLDPSATGYQAAFAWAVDGTDGTQYMIDLDNHLGGGVEQVLRVMNEWLDRYDIHHWVIEENGFQRGIRQDPRVKEFQGRHDVYIEGHQTQGHNKLDPLFGVGAMSRMYAESKIDLPFQTPEAKEKTLLYTRQMLHFGDDQAATRRAKSKSDVLMASWFPQKPIRRWQKETQAAMSVGYDDDYAEANIWNDMEDTPWR